LSCLVLIRHAHVAIDPAVPPDRWALSDAGRQAATALRRIPAVAQVMRFFSSPEPKAVTTARAIAGDRPVELVDELRELDRGSVGWLASAEEYAALVAQVLQAPSASICRAEPAGMALDRFARAVDAIVWGDPGGNNAIVSHGIVLTLYLSALRGLPAPDLDLWRRLRSPDVAIVDPFERKVVADFGDLPWTAL
jgi:broad specificity phosphatase PhoE